MCVCTRIGIAAIVFCLGPEIAPAPQSAAPQDPDVVRSGKNFIPTPVYSEEEDRKILALFAGLRVADVVDGMDKVGNRDEADEFLTFHDRNYSHRY